MKIKTVAEAIKFLSEVANISVEIVKYKYRVFDEDFNTPVKTDEDLINYAK